MFNITKDSNLFFKESDFIEIGQMFNNQENYLQKIAFKICNDINYQDPFFALEIMNILSIKIPISVSRIKHTLFTSKDESLLQTVCILNNW